MPAPYPTSALDAPNRCAALLALAARAGALVHPVPGPGEDEDEEYEIPTTVVTESRPSAIRFGEDLIRREEPEDATKAKAAAKKQRRPSRFSEEEEDDMDDIEYSGRIH